MESTEIRASDSVSLVSDFVEDTELYLESRMKQLGFKPQKEMGVNKLLPYSGTIDDESQIMLRDIKVNLGKCVLLKELRPGCLTWSFRLLKYIQMFGMKFSKEDHITFIKLLYELLTIPRLEPNLIFRFATCLTWLLKKKELISREELVLPWRPLYNVCDLLMCSSKSSLGMYRYSAFVENSLSELLVTARVHAIFINALNDFLQIGVWFFKPQESNGLNENSQNTGFVYFEPTATQEMLELWRPQLCPLHVVDMQNALELLDTFLPSIFLPQETGLGYELWLQEFLDLWKTCHNSPPWEPSMMSLLSRVASHNVGLIDWEPHMALMYTRILRSFSLPVNYKKMKVNKYHKLSITTITVWIISTLGGGSSSQKHLDRMMKVLESYFHPANAGVWASRLREFLRKLTYYFVQRIYIERYSKPCWLRQIPEQARLTEEDITQFVESTAPAVSLAMYSRVATEVSMSLQYLASLRPAIVIPPIIESMYNTMGSLTEPHKYTAAMLSLVSVARPLVESNDYKAGPTHVIPLLIAVLPGIDPNDIRKCFITFQVITTFTSMIPIVDSSGASEYWKDLTEEEEVVCAATSELEDFVLEFLDRCFTLVDNSVLESTRLEQNNQNKQQRSRMENVAENAIVSTVTCLLNQTSPQIFKSALRKLYTFITSRILETTVSGRCVASICRTFAKVRPEETLRLLLPHFCQTVLSYAEHEDIRQEETLDNELLYNLLLLSEVVQCQMETVMRYSEQLEKVLDLTLHLKCREGYTRASRLLTNILMIVSTVRPCEFRSSNEDYAKPVSEFLPIREWGKSFQIQDITVEWSTPGEKELSYSKHLISKYLCPELETIESYSAGLLTLTREELQCSLSIVIAFLGLGRILPMWDEPICAIPKTVGERKHFYLKSAFLGSVTMPDGSNVRKAIATVIFKLQAKLFATAEDDTKSLNSIVNIWNGLMLNIVPSTEEYEAQAKALVLGKKIYKNKVLGRKKHIRSIVINQAFHQHETILAFSSFLYTRTHADIALRLLELSTSHYSEVRKNAQRVLLAAMRMYRDDFMIQPKLIEILKQDSNLHHERFKGALYLLLGPRDVNILTRQDWSLLKELWPVVVRTQPSEKPSVISLLNAVSELVSKQFPTINIDVQMENKGEEFARALLRSLLPDEQLPTAEDIAGGCDKLAKKNETNKADYLELLDSLNSCINSNLHWRHHSLALGFLRDLVHPHFDYPPQIIRSILHTLIHDNIEFRKIAIKCTVFVLKQQKRTHKYRMREVDIDTTCLRYGDREDNQWLQYDSATAPKSQEAWDEPRYAHKPYIGYYAWNKELKVNAPSIEQPPIDRTRDEMTVGEREVDSFFSNKDKLSKLIGFLSLEEKKGKDKFNGMHSVLFKNLFRNHGDQYMELFKPHLERLIADKHESNQRCAAEIITGIIRGAKHWPYDKVERMWQYLTPLLRTAFANMTVETVHDWSVMAASASEDRDPNRHHWLLELLMEDPLREEASFIDCGRLCALQGAVNQQEWRVAELFHRLLDYLTPKLSHPYQLLRERIGSVLTNIFALDLPTTGPRRTRGPLISQFVAGIMPQLLCLYTLSSDVTNNQPQVAAGAVCDKASNNKMEVDINNKTDFDINETGKNSAICLLKTMVKWMTNSVVRADYSAIPEFFAFLPLVCLMENYEADDELNKVCTAMLAAMAQCITLPEFLPTALAAINEVAEMSSWSARATCLDFLQVFVFHNLPTISSQESWVSQVNALVFRLLKDERVEVREKAGQVLSGLIHCGFVSDKRQLLNDVKRLAAKRNDLAKRHAGVLGLCAFISANPYDVVDPVPEIFLMLGSHLNDPQPIPRTITKTLGDFKRTHHDSWQQNKLKFTEDQLAVLSDLIVPPSYYA